MTNFLNVTSGLLSLGGALMASRIHGLMGFAPLDLSLWGMIALAMLGAGCVFIWQGVSGLRADKRRADRVRVSFRSTNGVYSKR
jgi:hypothetical protein